MVVSGWTAQMPIPMAYAHAYVRVSFAWLQDQQVIKHTLIAFPQSFGSRCVLCLLLIQRCKIWMFPVRTVTPCVLCCWQAGSTDTENQRMSVSQAAHRRQGIRVWFSGQVENPGQVW